MQYHRNPETMQSTIYACTFSLEISGAISSFACNAAAAWTCSKIAQSPAFSVGLLQGALSCDKADKKNTSNTFCR
jgi:hypothetical protein